jgi:hypothetical protein
MPTRNRVVRVTLAAVAAAVLSAAVPAYADEWSDPESGPSATTDDHPMEPAASGDRWSYLKTPFSGKRHSVLDVHGGIMYYTFGFGVGARYTWIFIHNGFIPKLNNSFGIGAGVDVLVHPAIAYYTSFGLSFVVPVVAQWAFYLTKQWTVFAEVGAALWIRPLGIDRSVCLGAFQCSYVWAFPIAGVGAMYHFSDSMALILRAQFPFLSAGIAF